VTLNNNQSITVKIISLQNNADNRVKKCNEMIQSMRVIKLLAWESLFEKTIDQSRKAELWALFKNAMFRLMFSKFYRIVK
jgi:hypothetical protein